MSRLRRWWPELTLATLAFLVAHDVKAAGADVYECTTPRGFPVTIGWGSGGPPDGWTPALFGCVGDGPEGAPSPTATQQEVDAFLRAHFLSEWGPVLDCIAATESASAGGYTALNPTSGAAGKFQFMPRTGDFAVRLAGHPEWAGIRADHWPPWAQDAAAVALIHYQHDSVLPAWAWSGHCNRLVPR